VADAIKADWDYICGYYPGPQNRSELGSFRLALRVLRRLYGETLAWDFGPVALQTVREAMIKEGWSRPYVNRQTGRVKRCFKWAASQELVPPSVFHGLQAVDGLRKRKTGAPETDPVKPVPEEWVKSTLDCVSRQVGGMIRLQWATGMRPGEAVIMRGCDLDTSGKVWVYTPQWHKTEHHGHERPIYLGPQAQAIVSEFLKPDTTAYLVSAADAERERRVRQHERRKTSLSCGNKPGSNRRRKTKKTPKASLHHGELPPRHRIRMRRRLPAAGGIGADKGARREKLVAASRLD
jgi:integrase